MGIAWLAARAQTSPMLPENSATRVSDHVYAILGFPNVAIVLGSHASLVVDTGMGPKNGAIVVRQTQKLAQTQRMYLTTTHFHPEHAAGLQAFPGGTVLIRPAAQQEEMDRHGMEFIQMFRSRSDINRALLEDVVLRTADITFDHEVKIDLGSVTVRLFWLGPAHTRGDELIFVEPDEALISGDVVQSKIVPNMPSTDASPRNWIAILDQIEGLRPRYVVPDHGELGDASLIRQQRAFLVDLQSRALALKSQGLPVEDAAKQVTDELQKKYSGWTGFNNIANTVRRVYAESQ
jgi:glyoxylase-like metal-dependent hydrolase (beta-lactamase superfamily II)